MISLISKLPRSHGNLEERRKFATAVTQSISDLEGQPTMEIKVDQKAIFITIKKFEMSQINLI